MDEFGALAHVPYEVHNLADKLTDSKKISGNEQARKTSMSFSSIFSNRIIQFTKGNV